jgi:hypothetical protein
MFEGNVLRAWLHSSRLIARQTFSSALVCAIAMAASAIGLSQPAQAVPSFARQTGQPCGTCHTDYPGLTPYGRLFKLNGYTAGGGKFRTTLFPLQSDPANALAAYAKKTDAGKGADSTKAGSSDMSNMSNVWVPPIAAMAVFGYTHTQAPQDPDAIAPYNPNDNWTIPQISLFWGGAITEHVGAFSQWTYDGRSAWGWDNQDIRYSNTAMLGNMDVIYGISADNNPTMGDPWNTVPAWGFPYMSSNVAPDPGVGTVIDGAFGQAVAGAGAYGYFGNLVYLQVSGYRSINPDALGRLGADPYGAPFIDGVAPYWRAAIEPHWGRHWLEFGTFGMYARVHPWMDDNTQATQTDRYTDIAFDTQYQYQGDNYWLTLRGTYIHEYQSLDASFTMGAADNPTNTVNTLRLYASLAYGNDNRFVFSGQYFDTWGSMDASFFAGDTNGYVVELAYIPFINSQSPVYPWANVRIGAKYTYYNKFDGMTEGAHDNNTLFLYAWFAM